MRHLKPFNESFDQDIVNDIMNIANDDNLLNVSLEEKSMATSIMLDYQITKTEFCNDDHLLKVCQDINARLKNEDIEQRMWVDVRNIEKGSAEYGDLESFGVENYDHNGSTILSIYTRIIKPDPKFDFQRYRSGVSY